MVETLQELIEFTKIFNQTELVYKALVGDPSRTENVVAVGNYATHSDINSGVIANAAEYERRLVRYLIDQLRLDLAQDENLDLILNDYFGVGRPVGYGDPSYYAYGRNRVLSQKESAAALIAMLQPFSSQPVVIFEGGDPFQVCFANAAYANWHPYTHDNNGNVPVTPDYMSGSDSEQTYIYYFRIKLLPINPVAEKIIVALLKLSHVAGVKYDIEYYALPDSFILDTNKLGDIL